MSALTASCGGATPAADAPSSAATAATAPATAATPIPPKTWRADADAEVTLPGGATFPVAAGWSVTEHADRVVLEDPEGQLHLVYAVVQAKSGADAIAAAWKRHDPSFAVPAKQTITPPSPTWDEVVQTVYDTPGTRVVIANARRKGDTAWVALVDAPAAAIDRRGAQMQNSFDGLEVPGVDRESLAGREAAPLDDAKKKALLEFAEEARAALKVPGAALAVVQGGKVVLEAGLGVRELGKPAKVTPRTPFLIGSTTKSLSTLLMAKAVDEGKLAWDAKVRSVDPTFALGDPALTESITVQQLFCACTGIPRTDLELLFTFAGQEPEDLVARMSELKPTTKLGETFQYNNQIVAFGGFLAARAFHPKLPLGQAYDRAMRERVLLPLGMTDATFDVRAAGRRAAASHGQDVAGEVRVLPWSLEEFVVPLRPSGGLVAHAGDMAKYAIAELAKGKSVTGAQVASEDNVLRRRAPQVKIGDDAAYGMGLVAGKVKGIPFVEHGGATFGHRSTFFLLPEHDTALVVLANGPGPLGNLLKARLLELVLGARPAAADALAFQVAEEKKGVERFAATLVPAPSAEAATALVGRYDEPRLGELVVTEAKGELVLDAGEWKSRAGWQKRPDGAVDLVLLDPPVAGLPFEVREEGGKKVLHLAFQQHGYTFRRAAKK
jgi:CubicO group peptidase (beta-lactamase class C family)